MVFVKLRFADFSRTTVERLGNEPDLDVYRSLLIEGWGRREPAARSVRLIGLGVRYACAEKPTPSWEDTAQLALALS